MTHRLCAQKPEGDCEAIRAHFGLASCAEVALIGDRYLTDVLFGNRHGMFTIRTAPFCPEKDNFVVRLVRESCLVWMSR
jgi:phosphatidylglycerophosphatase GEP4